jgi:drug/metabolite transporter (DMT)-like permease
MTQGESISWTSFTSNIAAHPVPYVFATTAAISWASYNNLTTRWAGGLKEGGVILFLPAAAVVLGLTCLLFDEPRDWTRRALLEALYLGAVMYAGYAMWDNAMRRGNVTITTSVSYLTPLLSTIMSCLYLAVLPGAQLWVGCGLLIVGSFLSWRSITAASSG